MLWLLTTAIVYNVVIGIIDGVRELRDEDEQKLLKHLDDIVHRIEMHIDKDTTYWFDFDDGEFLGQGKTITEMTEGLKTRFPTHLFVFTVKETNYLLAEKTEWKPFKLDTDSFRAIITK
jgi:hypothetical protein